MDQRAKRVDARPRRTPRSVPAPPRNLAARIRETPARRVVSHALSHSLTRSIGPLIHSSIHSSVHSLVHSTIHSSTQSTRSLGRLVHWSIDPFVDQLVGLFDHSFVHSLTRSIGPFGPFVGPYIGPFDPSLVHALARAIRGITLRYTRRGTPQDEVHTVRQLVVRFNLGGHSRNGVHVVCTTQRGPIVYSHHN